MKITTISLEDDLYKETLDAIKKTDSDFSKYTRIALREQNKKVIGKVDMNDNV